MRKITVETTAFLKINCGNYETLDVSKTIKEEIEIETAEELVEKSKKQDNMVASLLKADAEAIMEKLGRRRIMKVGGADTPVELWKSYVS